MLFLLVFLFWPTMLSMITGYIIGMKHNIRNPKSESVGSKTSVIAFIFWILQSIYFFSLSYMCIDGCARQPGQPIPLGVLVYIIIMFPVIFILTLIIAYIGVVIKARSKAKK